MDSQIPLRQIQKFVRLYKEKRATEAVEELNKLGYSDEEALAILNNLSARKNDATD